MQPELERPIRVVLFGGGPVLEHDVRRFVCRLEAHPDIQFLGGFFQSEGQTAWSIVSDLWRRRGLLAVPLLLLRLGKTAGLFMSQPRAEMKLNRNMARLSERIHLVPDIHAEDVLARVRALASDLGLIYGSPILKPELFEIPRFGTLGIHHGKLPEYRGKKTTFWAMFNGEQTAGVTIQRVNACLDGGEIVKQGEVLIGRHSQRTVWKGLEDLGLDLYIQAILDVKLGTARYRPQGVKGQLYRDPKIADLLTLWWRQSKKHFTRS
jgi:methionyl-tRNA formyltransferase